MWPAKVFIHSALKSMLTECCFLPSVCSTHTLGAHTHSPQLNSITVVVRCLLGSPLIWPGLLCLLSRPARHAEPVFNMAAQPWSQSNNKLYLQLSAGLNHWDYDGTESRIPINISVGRGGKKVNRPPKDKYRWASGRISLCNLNFITCKYGAEVELNEPQFLWMRTLIMEFFLGGGLFCHKCTISHPQRASALLSFTVLGGTMAGNL